MSAREEVLARVRSALGTTSGPGGRDDAGGHGGGTSHGDGRDSDTGTATVRDYRTRGEHPPGHPALIDLLVDRIEDYRAGVRRMAPDGLADAVAQALAAGLARTGRGNEANHADRTQPTRARVVVPPGLPLEWLAAADVEAEAVVDEGLDADALDALDGIITAAAVAVAETGTIVLDASPDQGRRAITLVPDLHVCVVRADQVVASVPEAVARLDPTRPLTWISGRPRRATSSSTASRACTAPAPSR